MKKKQRQIIFETRQITRIHITRRHDEAISIEPDASEDHSLPPPNQLSGRTPLRERLNGFWKRGNRRLTGIVKEDEIVTPDTEEERIDGN